MQATPTTDAFSIPLPAEAAASPYRAPRRGTVYWPSLTPAGEVLVMCCGRVLEPDEHLLLGEESPPPFQWALTILAHEIGEAWGVQLHEEFADHMALARGGWMLTGEVIADWVENLRDFRRTQRRGSPRWRS